MDILDSTSSEMEFIVNIRHTNNQEENSVSVDRDNNTTVDCVSMYGELIVGQTDHSNDSHTQISLTPDEALTFADHIRSLFR